MRSWPCSRRTLGERLATGGVGSAVPASKGEAPSLCDRAAVHAVESATIKSSEKTTREDVLVFLRPPFFSKSMSSLQRCHAAYLFPSQGWRCERDNSLTRSWYASVTRGNPAYKYGREVVERDLCSIGGCRFRPMFFSQGIAIRGDQSYRTTATA